MMKLKQISTAFDVLYSREDNPWIGEAQCPLSSGTLFLGDFGQWRVLWLEEATVMIGQEVRDFL